MTDEFLKVYLARPELAPPPEACAAERTLHAALLADPRRPVAAAEIAAIADADARENWQVMLAFRDHLIGHRTVEAAYLDLVRRGAKIPHLFINQLVHVILRNALDDCEDPYVLRAAELFFRPQRMTLHEGSLIAADEETVAGTGDSRCRRWSPCSACRPRPRSTCSTTTTPITIWSTATSSTWRSTSPPGGAACTRSAQVIERWISHLLAVEVTVEPLTEVQRRQARLVCRPRRRRHADRRRVVERRGARRGGAARIVGLFRLTFRDPGVVLDKAKGEPVYLILAMTPTRCCA